MLTGFAVAVSVSDLFDNPRAMGEAGLVLLAAGVVGFLIRSGIGPRWGARELALLGSLGTVAGLAYVGVPAAGVLIWIFVVALEVVWALSVARDFL